MSKYVLKRILLMIPILIGVAIMIFTLMFFVPGDPVEIILGNAATEAQVTAVRAQLGLNQPYIVRLGSFLKELFFHGSFGNSYIYGTDVGAELMTRFPKTLAIAAFSILLSIRHRHPPGHPRRHPRQQGRGAASRCSSRCAASQCPTSGWP